MCEQSGSIDFSVDKNVSMHWNVWYQRVSQVSVFLLVTNTHIYKKFLIKLKTPKIKITVFTPSYS